MFHVAQRHFVLNAQEHRLVLLKQLTRELAAQEVAVWKKVIRVIAHELNNSLAPISSLANSGLMLRALAAARGARSRGGPDSSQAPVAPEAARLERVFTTIADRAAHLATFIDGYARFAKLPKPRLTSYQLEAVRRSPGRRRHVPADARRCPTRVATFDATQLEQVMINLLKNAAESGSAPEAIELSVRATGDGWMLEVADRGSGLSEDTLRDALMPFYSTKPSGTGLGLTLCRGDRRRPRRAAQHRQSPGRRRGGGALAALLLASGPERR